MLLLPGFVLFAFLGYWLARSAAPEIPGEKKAALVQETAPKPRMIEEAPVKFRRAERPQISGDPGARAAGALEGQRAIVFKDATALEDFLRRAGDRIRVLGRLDALNALRIGFDDYDDIAEWLEDEEESFIFPVTAPAPPEGTVQSGAVALGNHLREWLGITGDNASWGTGVRIAVLDTGIAAHRAFSGTIQSIDLLQGGSPVIANGHGTAVASVIAGSDPLTPGVAPSASLTSIRIAGDDGMSDSYLLAQGIVEAVRNGAQLINISMGSQGDSAIVRQAVEYARQQGSLIIAAAGNNGIDQVSYPAANEGVIAVGAVDATGSHLDFSNSGQEVDVSAPGYGINAAWTGDQAASMSGTSFSAPIVTGAIAAVMTASGGGLSASQAWEKLSSLLNDSGPAGHDPELGAGMPDIGRVLQSGTRGIVDAAVASNRILPPSPSAPYGQVEVLVQNRGTETLINTAVEVSAGGSRVASNITSLAPNAVKTITIPIAKPPTGSSGVLSVDSRVSLTGGAADAKPSNDRREETYVAGDAN